MIIKAPNRIVKEGRKPTVFLAGSIEMGTAENWQEIIAKEYGVRCTILNPRRDDWDSSWNQIYEDKNFRDQVIWEQTGIGNADFVLFYFDKNTKSPITLLEFGQCIGLGKKMMVCCPTEFWRYGNIEIMCHLYSIPLYNNLAEMIIDFNDVLTRRHFCNT